MKSDFQSKRELKTLLRRAKQLDAALYKKEKNGDKDSEENQELERELMEVVNKIGDLILLNVVK